MLAVTGDLLFTTFTTYSTRATWPAYVIPLDLLTTITPRELYKLRSYSSQNSIHSPFTHTYDIPFALAANSNDYTQELK